MGKRYIEIHSINGEFAVIVVVIFIAFLMVEVGRTAHINVISYYTKSGT